MNGRISVAVALAGGLALGGCQNIDGQTGGALIGAGLGGLLGSQFGDGIGQIAATIGGAAIGAFIGGAIGEYLTEEDKTMHAEATQTAMTSLDSGGGSTATQQWSNPQSGASGVVQVSKGGGSSGGGSSGGSGSGSSGASGSTASVGECRTIVHTITANDQSEEVTQRVCRNADGEWEEQAA